MESSALNTLILGINLIGLMILIQNTTRVKLYYLAKKPSIIWAAISVGRFWTYGTKIHILELTILMNSVNK